MGKAVGECNFNQWKWECKPAVRFFVHGKTMENGIYSKVSKIQSNRGRYDAHPSAKTYWDKMLTALENWMITVQMNPMTQITILEQLRSGGQELAIQGRKRRKAQTRHIPRITRMATCTGRGTNYPMAHTTRTVLEMDQITMLCQAVDSRVNKKAVEASFGICGGTKIVLCTRWKQEKYS